MDTPPTIKTRVTSLPWSVLLQVIERLSAPLPPPQPSPGVRLDPENLDEVTLENRLQCVPGSRREKKTHFSVTSK